MFTGDDRGVVIMMMIRRGTWIHKRLDEVCIGG
jgi:hypothetical protein